MSEEEQKEVSDRTSDLSPESADKPGTWMDTAWKVGESALFVADFLGEVFAEFFGMTQSRYQWAIDAYERQQRWERLFFAFFPLDGYRHNNTHIH